MAYIPVDHPERLCGNCRASFKPRRKNQKYCAEACKIAYWKKVREAGEKTLHQECAAERE